MGYQMRSVMFSSKRLDHGTPDDMFKQLNREFHFTLDVCANRSNAMVKKFLTKYDDGLRMILDCTEELERALAELLAKAASERIVRCGLHRQDAAMMTCFTPSVMRSDHVHFIDGARGGYASAATALKAMAA